MYPLLFILRCHLQLMSACRKNWLASTTRSSYQYVKISAASGDCLYSMVAMRFLESNLPYSRTHCSQVSVNVCQPFACAA